MSKRENINLFTTKEAILELKRMGLVSPSIKYLSWYFIRTNSLKGVRWILKFDLEDVKGVFEENDIFDGLSIYGSLVTMNVPNAAEQLVKIERRARQALRGLNKN